MLIPSCITRRVITLLELAYLLLHKTLFYVNVRSDIKEQPTGLFLQIKCGFGWLIAFIVHLGKLGAMLCDLDLLFADQPYYETYD